MVLGAGQDISPSGGSQEGCISAVLLRASQLHRNLQIQWHPKVPRGLLQPCPCTPKSGDSPCSGDSQCSSRLFPPKASQRTQVVEAAVAKSLSPDGSISTHLFSDGTGNRRSDHGHGRVPSRTRGWGRAHRELSEAQGSVCTHPPKITGQLEWQPRTGEGREEWEGGGAGREEGDKCVTRGRRAGTLTTRLVRCKDGMLRSKKSLSKGR